MITVADLFGDVGAQAAKIIGPAPAPGQKITYDVEQERGKEAAVNLKP